MVLLLSKNLIRITPLILILFITACTPNEEIWTGRNINPIQVVCGKSCQTIIFPTKIVDKTRCVVPRQIYRKSYLERCSMQVPTDCLTSEAKQQIRKFVSRNGKYHRIFVSVCATNPNNYVLNEKRIS